MLQTVEAVEVFHRLLQVYAAVDSDENGEYKIEWDSSTQAVFGVHMLDVL